MIGGTRYVGHEVEHRPQVCDTGIITNDFALFTRAQPYLIGLLFGWILYKIKGKKITIPHVSSPSLNT